MSPFKAYLIEQKDGKVVLLLSLLEAARTGTGVPAIQGFWQAGEAWVRYGE